MENTDHNKNLQARLLQFLRIYPEESRVLIIFGLVFFSNSVATSVASVAAVSGFLKDDGLSQIPILWIIDMLVTFLFTGLQSLIIDRFERTRLLKAMSIGFAMIFAILRLMFYLHTPNWLNYGTIIILSEQQWMFFPLVFWTLAQDVFSVAQAKRLFPLIVGMGLSGQLIGFVIVSTAPQLLNKISAAPEELLLLNVAIYLAAYFLLKIGLKKVEVRPVTEQQGTISEIFMEGWDFVKNVPAFGYLTNSIFAISLGLTVVEFAFLAVTLQTFTTNFQTFYGFYCLGVMILSTILQGLVVSRLIEKLTLKNSFLLTPLALLGGSLAMLFTGAGGAIISMLLPEVTLSTVDDSVRRSFQSLVPEERRGRVSVFMESYLYTLGVVIASLLILGVLFLGKWIGERASFYIYRGLAIASSFWAIWAILKMRQVYDHGMLNWRLKRRQRSVQNFDKLEF